jgi:hypothetical protein
MGLQDWSGTPGSWGSAVGQLAIGKSGQGWLLSPGNGFSVRQGRKGNQLVLIANCQLLNSGNPGNPGDRLPDTPISRCPDLVKAKGSRRVFPGLTRETSR